MGSLLKRRSCITCHIVSSCLLNRIERASRSRLCSLLLRIILWLLHAEGILFFRVVTIQNLRIIQVSLLSYVSSAVWGCIDVASGAWLVGLVMVHVILVNLGLVSARDGGMRWSFSGTFRWFSWFWRRLVLDFFKSIPYSWLALVHRDCRVIFIEGWRFFISLHKLLFIVHLMIATESRGTFNKRGGRIFADTWRLVNKIVLQLSLILAHVALNIRFGLGLVGSSLIYFGVGWSLLIGYLWFEDRWWFFFSEVWVMNLTSFFSVGIDFFWGRFRKSTRNSSIRIKAVDVRFLTWSGDSLGIVYVVATAVGVVVTVDTWVVLIPPLILGCWAICFR